jgi:hypothetical protein
MCGVHGICERARTQDGACGGLVSSLSLLGAVLLSFDTLKSEVLVLLARPLRRY